MRTIVIGVTGSIACYKACDVVSALRKEKELSVHVIMTPEATRFVSALTFQALSGNKVYSDLFEAPEQWDLLHTTLSAQADLVLVCPATLNILSKMATGIADDLLSCTLFATRAPVIAVPAMNTRMYEHPVTQENLKKLQKLGVELIGPVSGELACRDVGMGHIAEPKQIVTTVMERLGKSKT